MKKYRGNHNLPESSSFFSKNSPINLLTTPTNKNNNSNNSHNNNKPTTNSNNNKGSNSCGVSSNKSDSSNSYCNSSNSYADCWNSFGDGLSGEDGNGLKSDSEELFNFCSSAFVGFKLDHGEIISALRSVVAWGYYPICLAKSLKTPERFVPNPLRSLYKKQKLVELYKIFLNRWNFFYSYKTCFYPFFSFFHEKVKICVLSCVIFYEISLYLFSSCSSVAVMFHRVNFYTKHQSKVSSLDPLFVQRYSKLSWHTLIVGTGFHV